MNKMNQYTKGFSYLKVGVWHAMLLMAFAVTGLTMASCKDQPDAYEVADGTPTIHYVRCLSTEIKNNNDASDTHYTKGELVESASPQSTLCLVGDNLRSVYELYFNDCKAILNTSYITDNTLIVDVPKSVPKKVTNKIYMVTRDGQQTTYDFSVDIPAPSINAMSCEYAGIGDRVTFTGDYYVDYADSPLEIYFTDANGSLIPAEINSIADDYTSVDVTIPEGAAKGPISMTSIYGTSTSAFYYLDDRGLMFDFDNGRIDQGWHAREILAEGGIRGNYVQLGDGTTEMTEDGGWADGAYSFEYWCGDPTWNTNGYPNPQGIRLFDIEGVDMSKPENMILKFEMCIPASNPWKAGAMQIIFAPTDYVHINGTSPDSFGEKVHGANNIFFRCPGLKDDPWEKDEYFKDKDPLPRALYRPWTTTGSYDTGGKWQTVTIPIASSFVYSFDGSGLTFNLKERDFASLTMFIVAGGVKGESCYPIVKIDNIRVIPNKK